MDPALLVPMYRFNTWANEHIRQAIEGVDEALVRRRLDLWFGSAFDILAHLVGAEEVWFFRLSAGVSPTKLPNANDYPSVAELVEDWRDVDAAWEEYAGGLTAEALDGIVEYTRQNGSRQSQPRWQPLVQVVFHGAEHRAHAGVALTQLGITHGLQDFNYMFIPPVGAQQIRGQT